MRHALTLMAFMAALAGANRSMAQGSLYTQNQLGNIYRTNSARYYSANRIRDQVINRTVPRWGYNTLNQNLLRAATQKPFSGGAPRSSVSPYLGLSAPFSSTAEQYYTQVRPQLQQQRINQQMANRSAQMQHQLNSIAAQPPYALQGTDEMSPTGHGAVFMNLGGFYPEAGGRR